MSGRQRVRTTTTRQQHHWSTRQICPAYCCCQQTEYDPSTLISAPSLSIHHHHQHQHQHRTKESIAGVHVQTSALQEATAKQEMVTNNNCNEPLPTSRQWLSMYCLSAQTLVPAALSDSTASLSYLPDCLSLFPSTTTTSRHLKEHLSQRHTHCWSSAPQWLAFGAD